MSDEKKLHDEPEVTDEDLKDVAGGIQKSGDVTLKRGVINSTDTSDPSKSEDLVDSTVAHDDWKLDDPS